MKKYIFPYLIVYSLSLLGCSRSGNRGRSIEDRILPSIEVLNSSKEKKIKSLEEPHIISPIFNEDEATILAYLCNNGKTTKYHLKENCRGLSNCQYKIVKTTLEKVKKDKKTLCKWEE